MKRIPDRDVTRSPVLRFIRSGSTQPAVFLPNYGEFGATVNRSMRLVHFCQRSAKVVCCKRGEEALFPSATAFYYDWDDFIKDEDKWALFSKVRYTGRGTLALYLKQEEDQYKKIRNNLGHDYEYVPLRQFSIDHVFQRHLRRFSIPLTPRVTQNLRVDVVISPRQRRSRPENNCPYWDVVAAALIDHGFTVGCIGSKDTSSSVKGAQICSWDFEDYASAGIELLAHCKLYLGLDTGPSHLAALMRLPMIVFSHTNNSVYLTYLMQRMAPRYFLDLGRNSQACQVIEAALAYLNNSTNGCVSGAAGNTAGICPAN